VINLDKYDYILCASRTTNGDLGEEAYKKLLKEKKITALRLHDVNGWEEIIIEYVDDRFDIVEQTKQNISEDLEMYIRLKYL
jgi:hypothetical protein